MNRRVLLILADGFRPEALSACGHPFAEKLLDMGSFCLNAATVYPSVTLPCHMSLFHSVSPDRHGILTNTYVPLARPVSGLCEQLAAAGKSWPNPTDRWYMPLLIWCSTRLCLQKKS